MYYLVRVGFGWVDVCHRKERGYPLDWFSNPLMNLKAISRFCPSASSSASSSASYYYLLLERGSARLGRVKKLWEKVEWGDQVYKDYVLK